MGYLGFLRQNWLFLLAGFLLTFTSSYGQTYFISLFAGEIRTDFGLSDGQWGGIYTVGTTMSAVTMIWAGVLTDRFRVRVLAFGVMLALSGACIAMAANTSWVLLILVIFALRLTGQGMMSQLGAVAMVRWLIEGTTVSTKHGPVKTDHVLFIASGAFHIAKPSDLLPELQGRLPIRVELRALTEEDFVRILTETDNALTLQYTALMGTENVTVSFTTDGIAALAKIAADVNQSVENIGARRLYTVMERVFEELSFNAPDRGGDAIEVNAEFVEENLGELTRDTDLSRYVL